MQNPLRNIVINLHARGPAAVIVAWIGAVTALGIWGTGKMASDAMSMLAYAGGAILVTLAAKGD